MTVRFFPGKRLQKTGTIAGFLSSHQVAHELGRPEEYQSKTVRLGMEPALEVDGQLFIDPNVDALRKILLID